ncbi:MAG TPA: nucleoside triphosphate pyrophosphohydrolase [Clostridiaceae bacterium]|nr:nucleoside triphosphate pyrophosphohydrolase [Clostridiaceae bacterium]
MIEQQYEIDDLISILAFLRSPDGCPWDREQTHASIKHNLIEEAYEVIDAIQVEDPESLKEELGDVLMQVVFHARMAEEKGEFDFNDVVTSIARKLISRHTHVFGQDVACNSAEVLQTWEKNKKIEKGQKSQTEVLRDVPRTLPALTRAYKVQKRAALVGFDWPDSSGSLAKIQEELEEIKEQIEEAQEKSGQGEWSTDDGLKAVERESGDLLFAVVNYLRALKVEPEVALNLCTDRFICRFAGMEQLAGDRGEKLESMTLEELDKLWDEIKLIEKREENASR